MIFKTFRGNVAFYFGLLVYLSIIVGLVWGDRNGIFDSATQSPTQTLVETCPAFSYWSNGTCVAQDGHELWCLYHDENADGSTGECVSFYTLPEGSCVNGKTHDGESCNKNSD